MGQPKAPEGFRWEVIKELSDEFEGRVLDSDKWHDHNPSWIGRPPGKFMSSSVSLKDGNLSLQCTPLSPTHDGFSIACGTIQAKQKALYGYYECRMKASQLSTSSNFWFVGKAIESPLGKLGLELIVQFTIGKSEQHNQFMKSNAMVSLKRDDSSKREKAKATDRIKLKSSVSNDFHRYGCWWVDGGTLKFYVDGDYAYTLHPSDKFGNKPFRHPLAMTFVCETFDWQPTPSRSELSDDSLNTTLVDYVRAYRLVKVNESPCSSGNISSPK